MKRALALWLAVLCLTLTACGKMTQQKKNSPLFDVKAEDVERIEYANDSVPSGECAVQYTQTERTLT